MFWYPGIVFLKRTIIKLARESLPNSDLVLTVLETNNFKPYRDRFMTSGKMYLGVTSEQINELVDIVVKDTLKSIKG